MLFIVTIIVYLTLRKTTFETQLLLPSRNFCVICLVQKCAKLLFAHLPENGHGNT
jgi:hypothetical protein